MPKISVLMSTHNVEDFVDVAVQSILRQTVSDFEFLIADDASTDNTWNRLLDLSSHDSRIHLWRRDTNHGNVANQNFLFSESRGDYIAFMDGDDVSFPIRFERQLEALESGRADICGGWILNFGVGDDRVKTLPVLDQEIKFGLLFNCSLYHPTVLMRRRVFESVEFRPEATPAADYDYWVRVSAFATMENLPEVLLGRRLRGGQVGAERYAEQAEVRRRTSLLALSNLGVSPSQEEHRLHLNLFGQSRHLHSHGIDFSDNPNDGVATREWVKKLWLTLQAHDYTTEFLAKRWYMYCLRSTAFGLKTYQLFRSFNPDRRRKGLVGKRTIMFVLCLLRVHYHSWVFGFLSLFRKETRYQRQVSNAARRELRSLFRELG